MRVGRFRNGIHPTVVLRVAQSAMPATQMVTMSVVTALSTTESHQLAHNGNSGCKNGPGASGRRLRYNNGFCQGGSVVEYDFGRDLTGKLHAGFSMGHEAFGLWLIEEVGDDRTLMQELLLHAQQLKRGEGWEYRHEGTSYSLLLSREDAQVRAHALDMPLDGELSDEDLDLYDDEAQASCGLDDFMGVLEDWAEFVRS